MIMVWASIPVYSFINVFNLRQMCPFLLLGIELAGIGIVLQNLAPICPNTPVSSNLEDLD